jgi:hypothetical protein
VAGEQREALIRGFIGIDATLRDRVVAAVQAVFRGLGSWRDADIERFTAAVLPVVLGAQRQVGSLTQAYVTALIADMTGEAARPPAVDVATGAVLRNGVDPVEVYARPIREVWKALAAGNDLNKALEIAALRLEQILATDLQLAKTHAARAVMSDDHRVVGYRRVLTGIKTCGLCVVASTQRYHRGDLMPIHPGCVPAGSRVSAEGVLAVTRRRYSGELTVIRTAAGDEVTVTPNHPVLTDQGWVPGHLVREGDYVVRRVGRHRAVDGGPHEGDRPALIEDVWRSVGVSRLIRVPLATEDFHGDGAQNEVEIVRPDGDLSPVGDVSFTQPARKRPLVDREFGRAHFAAGGVLTPGFPGRPPSTVGLVGGADLGQTVFGGHLCRAHQAGLRSASGRYAVGGEYLSDGAPLSDVLASYSQLGHAVGVVPDDVIVGEVSPGASPGRFDPPAVEFAGQGRAAYADLGRRLLDRLSGQVELDRVVEIRRVDYSGHVYNLHTGEGWYQSNNYIVSNCDCGIAPIIGTDDPGHVLDGQLLDDVHNAIQERFGTSDRSARVPDYRDVLVTHEHGELGPVLARRGDAFTAPSDLH